MQIAQSACKRRTRLEVGDHKVGEAVNVARRLEHDLGRHRGALDLEHVLLEHKVLAPRLREVLLDRAAGRAVVVEAGDGAVDLERGDVEHAALEQVGLRMFCVVSVGCCYCCGEAGGVGQNCSCNRATFKKDQHVLGCEHCTSVHDPSLLQQRTSTQLERERRLKTRHAAR